MLYVSFFKTVNLIDKCINKKNLKIKTSKKHSKTDIKT